MFGSSYYPHFLAVAATTVIITASPAQADFGTLSARVTPKASASVVNWTGCYVGLHAGYVKTETKWDGVGSENGPRASGSAGGAMGGGQIGCSYQMGQWVFGIQADQSFTQTSFQAVDINPAYAGMIDRSTVNSFGSLTTRVGIAHGAVLGYVKGGLAWQRSDLRADYFGDLYSGSVVKLGYLVGAGLEYRISPSFSTFVEYNYANFGSSNVTLNRVGGPQTDAVRMKLDAHVVKVGVNWWFLPASGSR